MYRVVAIEALGGHIGPASLTKLRAFVFGDDLPRSFGRGGGHGGYVGGEGGVSALSGRRAEGICVALGEVQGRVLGFGVESRG